MSLQKTWNIAQIILSNLEMMFEDYKVDGYSGMYHNGRENGFYVKLSARHSSSNLDKVAFFSNLRNVDGIVVYRRTDGIDDGIDEKAYRNSNSFKESEGYKAAKFIMDWLLEPMEG